MQGVVFLSQCASGMDPLPRRQLRMALRTPAADGVTTLTTVWLLVRLRRIHQNRRAAVRMETVP